jgi:predicted nucleic acid-binding protein
MKRLFLDSSVLFSAAYSSRGHARDLILMGIRREIVIVISRLVIDETRMNLGEKAPDKLYLLDTIVENVPFEVVRPTKREVIASMRKVELKDAPIIAAARPPGSWLHSTIHGRPQLARRLPIQQ